jgi:hypothetical protein
MIRAVHARRFGGDGHFHSSGEIDEMRDTDCDGASPNLQVLRRKIQFVLDKMFVGPRLSDLSFTIHLEGSVFCLPSL